MAIAALAKARKRPETAFPVLPADALPRLLNADERLPSCCRRPSA